MNKFVSVVMLASVTAFMACSDNKKSGDAPCIFGADCFDEESSEASNALHCDVVVSKLLSAPHCFSSDFGQTMYSEDTKTIYSCEDNGLTEEGYWKPHEDFSTCDEYVSPYSSSSKTQSKKSSSSSRSSSSKEQDDAGLDESSSSSIDQEEYTSSSSLTSSDSEDEKDENGEECDVRVSEFASLPTCDESTLGLTAYLEEEGYICVCKVDEYWGGEIWSEHVMETSCEEYVSAGKDWSSLGSSSSAAVGFKGTFGRLVDDRDGKVYETVTIGTQTWMAENLNYEYVADTVDACDEEECESYCYENGCETNGHYYELGVVLDYADYFNGPDDWLDTRMNGSVFRSICPEGWRLPTLDDWNELYETIDSAYTGLQAIGYESWPDATNIYGFSAVPAGIEYSQLYEWRGVGEAASFWTVCPDTDRHSDGYTYCWWIIGPTGMGNSIHSGPMEDSGSSIRCIKD
jgi:uncharacterized protein (TIGR02145 family)